MATAAALFFIFSLKNYFQHHSTQKETRQRYKWLSIQAERWILKSHYQGGAIKDLLSQCFSSQANLLFTVGCKVRPINCLYLVKLYQIWMLKFHIPMEKFKVESYFASSGRLMHAVNFSMGESKTIVLPSGRYKRTTPDLKISLV